MVEYNVWLPALNKKRKVSLTVLSNSAMPEQEVRDRTNQAKSEQHFSNYNPIFQSHRDNWEEWEDFLLLSPFLHSTEIY